MARYRNHMATFFVTSEEWNHIRNNAETLGFSTISSYLRKIAIDAKVIQIDYSNLNPFTLQLQRIGTNINQIAKKTNLTKNVSNDDMQILMEQISNLTKLEQDIRSLITYAEEHL